MRITGSSVSMESTQRFERVSARSESLELTLGRPPQIQGPTSAPTISEAAPGAPSSSVEANREPQESLDLLILIRTFGLERDTHPSAREVRRAYATEVSVAVQGLGGARGEADAEASAGFSLRYDATETTLEREAVGFAARAQVTTADGRSLEVSTALLMERTEARVEHVSVRAGDAAKVDPLVVDLGAAPAEMDARMSFDLDGDGVLEETAAPGAGGAFLARDLDGDGTVESGRELFGPSTGNGFAELSGLDADANGWVDEADPAWSSLGLWSPTRGVLTSLSAAGVGALYTGAATTPFDLRSSGGQLWGSVSRTGIYLREDGTAGTVRHIDLAV